MSLQRVFESDIYELNVVGRHIYGSVQQSMKRRSWSANNTSIAEMMS